MRFPVNYLWFYVSNTCSVTQTARHLCYVRMCFFFKLPVYFCDFKQSKCFSIDKMMFRIKKDYSGCCSLWSVCGHLICSAHDSWLSNFLAIFSKRSEPSFPWFYWKHLERDVNVCIIHSLLNKTKVLLWALLVVQKHS